MESLPKEILIEIFCSLSLSTKKECRLVCKAWFSKIMTDDILYSHIELHSFRSSTAGILRHIKENEQVGKCVRHLKASRQSHQEIKEFIRFFPRVKYLKLDITHQDNIRKKPNLSENEDNKSEKKEDPIVDNNHSLQNLKVLVELNHVFEQTETPFLTTYLLSTPLRNLKSLFFSSMILKSTRDNASSTRKKLELIQQLKNAPALQKLTLHNINLTPAEVELVHENTPHLSSLVLIGVDFVYLPTPVDPETYTDVIQSMIKTLPVHSSSNITTIDITLDSLNGSSRSKASLELFDAWLLYIAYRYPKLAHLTIKPTNINISVNPSEVLTPNTTVLLSSCPELKSYNNMVCKLSEPVVQEMDKANIQLSSIDIYATEGSTPKHQLNVLSQSAQSQCIGYMNITSIDPGYQETRYYSARKRRLRLMAEDNAKIDMGLFATLERFSNLKTLYLNYKESYPLELTQVVYILKACQTLETLKVKHISYNPIGDESSLLSQYQRVNKNTKYACRLKYLALEQLAVTKKSESVSHIRAFMKIIQGMLSPTLNKFTLVVEDAIYKTSKRTVPSPKRMLIDLSQYRQLTHLTISYNYGKVAATDLERDKDKLFSFCKLDQGYAYLSDSESQLDFAFNLRLPPQPIVIKTDKKENSGLSYLF